MKFLCRGVWPAVLTPFDEHGAVAHAQLEKLVDLFVRQQLGGLYVTGSTGQWPYLTLEQRNAVVDRVIRTVGGRMPVMVHVGAATTDDAIALARYAALAGADAVSSVAPIYYHYSADVIFEHYRRIGAATELPLFVYHLSIVNQPALDARSYAERLLSLPHIGGMKITDGDLYLFGQLHTHTAGKLQLFSGADEVFCHAALSGAVGAIGSFYNIFGAKCQAVREAFVQGEFEKGRKFMLAFQSVIAEAIGSRSVWSFFRAAMRIKFGIDVGMPKAPLGLLDKPWQDAEVERLLARVEEA